MFFISLLPNACVADIVQLNKVIRGIQNLSYLLYFPQLSDLEDNFIKSFTDAFLET